MDGNGRGAVFVTWLDLRDGGTELWSAVSPDGGATWGDNTRVYQSPAGHICECCHPSAAMDGKGRVAVMWRNWLGGSRDMYAAMSDDYGKTFAPAQKLGSGTWKLNGCPMDGGAITFDADGRLRRLASGEDRLRVGRSVHRRAPLRLRISTHRRRGKTRHLCPVGG